MSGLRRVQTNDYELGLPEGWSDGTQVVLLAPEHPVFRANVQVYREGLPDRPLDEFLGEQRRQLAELPKFALIAHGERKLGPVPALFHSYAWNLPERPDVRIRQLQVHCRHEDELFTVTCSALEADWDAAEPGFELSLSAFSWR